MKKLLFFLFCVPTLFAFSQESKFGIKAGYNLSNQTEDYNLNYKPLSSFHVGVVFKTPLSKKLLFQPELFYSKKGSSFNVYEIRLNYIEIPLLLAFKIKKFALLGGPQYSHLIRAKRLREENEETKLNTSLPNIGFVIGAEFAAHEHLTVGVKYSRDVLYSSTSLGYYPIELDNTSFNGEEDPRLPTDLISSKTQVFQSYLTYYF